MITSRTLSTPVCVAASISRHVDVAPFARSRRTASHTPHGSAVGPLTQFSARARMRAVVVLPTPRGPGEHERLREPAARRARCAACA